MQLRPNQFYVKGHVPSSKNGRRCSCFQRATKRDGTTGKAGILLASEACEKYLASTKMQWFDTAKKFRDFVKSKGLTYPLTIRFHFIRCDKSSFDWVGPLETVQDCMTGHKFEGSLKGLKVRQNPFAWVPDDSVHYLTPDIANSTFTVDKETAGVIIEVVEK